VSTGLRGRDIFLHHRVTSIRHRCLREARDDDLLFVLDYPVPRSTLERFVWTAHVDVRRPRSAQVRIRNPDYAILNSRAERGTGCAPYKFLCTRFLFLIR